MATPHRVVDGLVTGLADGAKCVGDGVAGAVKDAGGKLMGGLDKPFADVTKKEGPHRIIDRLLNGTLDAASGVGDGIIGAAETFGQGIMKALDQPAEQTGIPPDFEGAKGLKLPELPELPKIGKK